GLDHPNIVPVYEAGEVGPLCYIASAYCPGPTLSEWLKQRTEPVPFRSAASLIATLADAVHHAHSRGVLHRDLKPSNILLSTESQATGSSPDELSASSLEAFVPKITDFGLAKLLTGGPVPANAGVQTHSGTIIGTPNYMAPEQAGGRVTGLTSA